MNLSMYNPELLNQYKSPSQLTRVITEAWFGSEMYCPCCLNDRTEKFRNNQKVYDFHCNRCKNTFQLKSQKKPFRKKVLDGEYYTLRRSIISNLTPNFMFMHYTPGEWHVKDLFFVPRFFISSSAIEIKPPINEGKRRAGWVGCYILFHRIPELGKITIVKNEKEVDRSKVHKTWKRMKFLYRRRPDFRGWASDVLKCIEDLSKEEFTLHDAYEFTDYLRELHPNNMHVEAKIRQQLQVLRDNGIVRFISPGKYQLLR